MLPRTASRSAVGPTASNAKKRRVRVDRGEHELVTRYAMLKVKSLDEGIEWATRYAGAVGAPEIEVGPVTEAWDIGVAPKPCPPNARALGPES